MDFDPSSFVRSEMFMGTLAVVLVILLGLMGYRAWQRSRITPEERERRRRAWLVATGKMGDALLVEMRGTLVFYTYSVRGVEYTASQDTAPLREKVSEGIAPNGAVSIKYDPRNPANSIVVSEQWSGLR